MNITSCIYSLSILSLTVIGTKLSCSVWRTRLLCFLFFFLFFFFLNSWVVISRRTSFAATAKGYSVSPVSCWSYQSICTSIQTSFNSVAESFPTRLKQNPLSCRKEHVLNQILFYVHNCITNIPNLDYIPEKLLSHIIPLLREKYCCLSTQSCLFLI